MTEYGPRQRKPVALSINGELIIYEGKVCAAPGCGIGLTSENRAGTRLLCHDHNRERNRLIKEKAAARAAPVKAAEAVIAACPRRQALRVALESWMRHSDSEMSYARFVGLMRDFELTTRLQRLIPESPPPDFTNPLRQASSKSHLTTKPEFPTAGSAHGV